MRDRFGRDIHYMRISVTDRCNYRCVYCMPAEGIRCVPMSEILTFEEIEAVCRQAASLGIRRLKITGGEPLVRRGMPKLIGMLKRIPGIEQVTMTTNGALLEAYLDELLENNLDAVNISLDTMDPEKFRQMTRGGNLSDVLGGLDAAVRSGIPVKLNTVLCEGEEWKTMLPLARELPVDIRFIEMMPIGKGRGYAGVSKQEVLEYLENTYGQVSLDLREHGNGPAVYYRIPGFSGCIGLITPIHGAFCGSCNRIRLSAAGQIKPCLCFEETMDVRTALRENDLLAVRHVLESAVLAKPRAHCFAEAQEVPEKKMMASIGG